MPPPAPVPARQLQRTLSSGANAAPPYVRLDGCRATGMRAARLGLLLDRGFVTAHGGREAALLAAAEAVRLQP